MLRLIGAAVAPVALAAGIAGNLSACGSAASQPAAPALLAHADGPIVLGAAPARVGFTSASAPLVSLATLLATIRGEQRLLLVLRGVTTERQPGVLFQLFLDVPAGDLPDPNGSHYVGTLNFYRATPAGAGAESFESFDITDAARAVEPLQMRDETTTVTIVAVGTPAAGARPRVGRLEIVRQ